MKQESIWEHFQNEDIQSFDGAYPRLNFLIDKISSGQRMLNIGVGSGELERLAIGKEIDVYSLDPGLRSIEKIREELGLGDHAQAGYSQSIPFENDFFDVVVMTEVLEHLDDEILDQTLSEVKRVLKSDGRFIGTVPAAENLSDSLIVCPHCSEKFHRWGHVQSFDEKRLSSLLEKRAFSDISVKSQLFISWKRLNFKGKLVSGIKLILWFTGIHGSGENLYFSARNRCE